VRPPKDLNKYQTSLIAGIQLINLALRQILCTDDMVKWSITVSYWNNDWTDKEKMAQDKRVAIHTRGTFSNSAREPEELEAKSA
jgi:hypothetical protein